MKGLSGTLFTSLVLVCVTVTQVNFTNGANILVYMGMGSYSHRIPIEPYVDALAKRGHHITILSSFPPKAPNPNPKIKEFNPPKLIEWAEATKLDEDFDVFKIRKNSQTRMLWFFLAGLGQSACEALYSDQEFMKWIKDPKTKFDIVVMDSLTNECAYGMVHYFKAKLVAFNTGQLYAWNAESNYGIPDETSSIPDGMMHFPPKMNFFQRLATAVMPIVWKAHRELRQFPKLEKLTREALNLPDLPSFKDIEANTSLFLVNNHWALEYPRSLPPNIIPIGGITWNGEGKNKNLPKNLEDFIQKGKEGFIYVSFGTVAEFTKFDPEIRQAFIDSIRKFPNVQFIWKSTFPIEEKLPENVLVDKWLPQADILAHPKIRLSVTHGGLGGVYEAIFSKVPVICFPIFAEQEYNADLMVHKGFAIKLELTTVTEPEFTEAVSKMLGDPSYKRQVEKVFRLFIDRPVHPKDLAVYWTEFLLRHDDEATKLMIPLSVGQPWWVRRQLDVWAFVLLVILLLLSIPLIILRRILKRLCGSKGKNKIKVKRN